MISVSIKVFICFRILFSVAVICFTLNGRLLPSYNFERFFAIDWLQCTKACQNTPSCISYNYEVYNDKSCFLNGCGFRDRCEALRNLVVSPGAIFHQLKKASNDTLCDLSKFTDELPIEFSEKSASPEVEIEPIKCSYEKNISHNNKEEQHLYHVTICSNREYVLDACATKTTIQQIFVRHVECTCSCNACKTLHMPSACVSPDVINEISEKCEDEASCKVKGPDVLCDFQRIMAIHISYVCNIQNKEKEGDKEKDDKENDKDYKVNEDKDGKDDDKNDDGKDHKDDDKDAKVDDDEKDDEKDHKDDDKDDEDDDKDDEEKDEDDDIDNKDGEKGDNDKDDGKSNEDGNKDDEDDEKYDEDGDDDDKDGEDDDKDDEDDDKDDEDDDNDEDDDKDDEDDDKDDEDDDKDDDKDDEDDDKDDEDDDKDDEDDNKDDEKDEEEGDKYDEQDDKDDDKDGEGDDKDDDKDDEENDKDDDIDNKHDEKDDEDD